LSYTFTFTQTTLLEPFSQVHRKEPLNNPSNHYIEASSTATLNLPTYLPRTKTDINMTTTPQFQTVIRLPASSVPSLKSNEMYTLLVDPPLPRFIAWVSLDRFYGAFGRIWRPVRRWDADCLLLLLFLFLLLLIPR
jgi:hypothetical protein